MVCSRQAITNCFFRSRKTCVRNNSKLFLSEGFSKGIKLNINFLNGAKSKIIGVKPSQDVFKIAGGGEIIFGCLAEIVSQKKIE